MARGRVGLCSWEVSIRLLCTPCPIARPFLCSCIPSFLWWVTVWACPLGLIEGLRSWSLFFFFQARNWGTQKGFCTQEGPQFLLSSNPSVFFDIPQSWGEQVLDRKEITFWIDRLVIKSAEEFGFIGIWFQSPVQFQLPPNLLGDKVMSTLPTFFCNRV